MSKVFRDPLHDLIPLERDETWLLKLIDTAEFQRLRRIRQLGLARYVYPGAEHSRFTHSLGVLNYARRMIRLLRDRYADEEVGKLLRDQAVVRPVLAASLLHDVGHGPLSHLSERAFKLDHEEWSCRLIEDDGSEINNILQQQQIAPPEVIRFISGQDLNPDLYFLKDIVSGRLDADRMDYLRRDSWMSGSRHGQFDSEWILNSLRVETVPKEQTGSEHSYRKLCLDASKGISAVVEMLIARMLMYKQVYNHKAIRAYEAEFIQMMRLATRLHESLPAETPTPVRQLLTNTADLPISDYLLIDDEVLWWAVRVWARSEPGESERDEALLESLRRHAHRLDGRLQPWATLELLSEDSTDDGFEAYARARPVERKVQAFRKNDDPRQFECLIDDLSKSAYAGFSDDIRQHPEDDDAAVREIFVVGGEGVVPLSSCRGLHVIEALRKEALMKRLHFDRETIRDEAGLD